MEILSIDTPELGNRSYIVHDGKNAVVIDPSRRVQQIIDLAAKANVAIKGVFETHIHNDYVTGGYALSQQLTVPYYVSFDEHVHFKREAISPEQTVTIGTLRVTALASPGHTHHHLSYLVEQTDATPALFSGGSLLYGAVGRTDLVSADATRSLTEAQYQTAHSYIERLEPATILYPTHGFGSFCAATETESVAMSTLAQQLKSNRVYTAKDKASFVEELIAGLDDYPSYYAYMAPANLKGPLAQTLEPPKQLTKVALMRALHTGAAIVDMRARRAYAAKHMPGTYNIELSNDLATYVGWLIAWNEPLILVAATTDEVMTAQEQLSLIGRELISGQISSEDLLKVAPQTGSYPVRTYTDLAKVATKDNVSILDVRQRLQWQKSHIPQAIHIPLHELKNRLDELTDDKEIWVHGVSGFRASIATSILASHGKQVVLIDDLYDNAVRAGLVPVDDELGGIVSEVTSGQAQLLDVRDNKAWETGHAKGAIHITLGSLLDGNTAGLQEDKPVYIYCVIGDLSSMAESFLLDQGFEAVNIGGLSSWEQADGEVESA